MQGIMRKVGDSIQPSEVTPRTLQSQIQKWVFNFIAPQIRAHIWLQGKFGGSPVFCIVHWNAPDFLMLNVYQLELLYPNSKIYVLDNGSKEFNTNDVIKGLKRFKNVTLFIAPNWAKNFGADRLFLGHTKGLQFLLNYAIEQRDEVIVFLDQDCILSDKIDDLVGKLSHNIILIGTRTGRSKTLVHASFMIFEPMKVNQLYGKFAFFHDRKHPANNTKQQFFEPYHGLSLKANGKSLFLEFKPHDEIPGLASYMYQGKTYAWHAGFSSATIGYSEGDNLVGKSISFYKKRRQLELEFMQQIHEKTKAQL
jgi:hypothetical protein